MGLATWTYIQAGARKMAVGAAHCGQALKLIQSLVESERLEFVEIPEELIGRVLGLGDLPRIHFGDAPRADDEDVVVLFLESFPSKIDSNIVPEWKPLAAGTPLSALRGAKIGGWALFGSVRGTKCASIGMEGPSFVFVEESGEAGNSGALMYNIDPQVGSDPVVIGIYLGVKYPMLDKKHRGRICPLPELTSLQFHPVREVPANPDRTLQITFKERDTKSYLQTSKKSVFRSEEGDEKLYGVFVSHEPADVSPMLE
jgi:hypothetical protein